MKLQEYLSNMTEDMQMRGLSEGSIQTVRHTVMNSPGVFWTVERISNCITE